MVMLANNSHPVKTTHFCLPINLLTKAATTYHSSQLVVKSNDITWNIYFERGRVSYGTNSLTFMERLERHLRFLKKDPALLKQIIRRQLEFFAGKQNSQNLCDKLECQSIYWLFKNSLVSAAEAATLTKRITEESLELFLLLDEEEISSHQVVKALGKSPILCSLELGFLIKKLAQRLAQWESLQPYIHSPYQRLYCGVTPAGEVKQTEFQQRFSKLLRGLSFRQLAALCSQDELQLAQKLLPSIQQSEIILCDPLPPQDWPSNRYNRQKSTGVTQQPHSAGSVEDRPLAPVAIARTWQIVCVDDSPTILEEINRILANPVINLTKVTDPLKAFMKVLKVKPDLILLDVGMPNIDGYKLCSLIRKNRLFKDTPIVMVTGHKSLIDKTRARLAGATDFLSKPFSSTELLDMVYQYLPE